MHSPAIDGSAAASPLDSGTPVIMNLYKQPDEPEPVKRTSADKAKRGIPGADHNNRSTTTPVAAVTPQGSQRSRKLVRAGLRDSDSAKPPCQCCNTTPGRAKAAPLCWLAPKRTCDYIVSVFRRFTCWQRFLVVCFLLSAISLSVVAIKYHHSILEWVQDAAVYLRQHKLRGYLILATATFATAFPPVPGYSLCCYVAGYAFGMHGFFPVYTAAIVGACVSFVLFRYFLVDCMFKWVANNKK